MKNRNQRLNRRHAFALGVAAASTVPCRAEPAVIPPATRSWNQWGGPTRDFRCVLPTDTPAPDASRKNQGRAASRSPFRLDWKRQLGKGHAAVVADESDVFTMHLEDDAEVLSCFRLETGKTRWRISNAIGYHAGSATYDGPHSTPCLAGDTILTVSIDAVVRAVDRSQGSTKWTRDLKALFGTRLPQSGYAASPLVENGRVIVPTLGNPQPAETERFDATKPTSPNAGSNRVPGVVALDLETGRTCWRSDPFRSSHASATSINVLGQDTVIVHGMFELVGVDPKTGSILWRHLLRRLASDNVSMTPLWDPQRNRFLVCHGYCENGAQAIDIRRSQSAWTTKTAWSNPKLRTVHSNAVVAGTTLVGTNTVGTELVVGIDIRDGRTRFRRREAPANLLCGADDTVVGLSETGDLFAATVSDDGLSKRWSQPVLESLAWTAPSIVGDRILVRDDREIRVYRSRGA